MALAIFTVIEVLRSSGTASSHCSITLSGEAIDRTGLNVPGTAAFCCVVFHSPIIQAMSFMLTSEPAICYAYAISEYSGV